MMEDSQGTSMYTNFFTSIYKHTQHTHTYIYIHTRIFFRINPACILKVYAQGGVPPVVRL